MLTIVNPKQFLKDNKFDHLGCLNDFLGKEDSENYKKFMRCVDKDHGDQRIVMRKGYFKTRSCCPVCMISFDVDTS